MTRLCLLSSLALALALTLSAADAGDWPRFRGPNGSGFVEGKLPDIDPTAPLWKVPIPAAGAAHPSS
ncbi:MAG: hypothetical protein HC853_14860 [Anaerolineae bacterium]|nr:hypothetical protein [Anaerolineae bacterium]